MTTTFIAEIGVNHNGSLDEALWLIDEARKSGADIAKFQLWDNKPQLAHLALGRDRLRVCADYCGSIGLEFVCTPFDTASLWWLIDNLRVRRIKLASSSVFDRDLLEQAERTRLPILLSTGMADETSLAAAVHRLRFAPGLTLLHCVSAYPAPLAQANMRAIETLRATYMLPVGYSDHTGNRLAVCAAAALGATTVEMHITRARDQAGPDHASSYTAQDFAAAVQDARAIEAMLGNGKIETQDCAMALKRTFIQ